MKSFGNILKANQGIGPGFDFLRVFLALSIVLFHAATVTNQYYPLDDSPMWMIHYMLVPMFFALSGFLVSASAERLDLRNFLINRGIRIVPALVVDTLVCMFIIGPIFTIFSLSSYFSDKEFLSYTLNMIGWVHFTLPGVFVELPFTRVNGSLWTVPFELICYGIISTLIVTKLVRTKYFILGTVFSYILVSMLLSNVGISWLIENSVLAKSVKIAFLDYEAQAVTAFLCGIVAYQNRDAIPYSWAIFGACIVTLIIIAFGCSNEEGQEPVARLMLMPLTAYTTVFIGLTPIPLPELFKRGDYSYGIYLYHQPFLQIIVSLVPSLALAPHYGFLFTFVIGLPLIIGVAVLSWHLVEKPSLAFRKRYSLAAKRRVEEASMVETVSSRVSRRDLAPSASNL